MLTTIVKVSAIVKPRGFMYQKIKERNKYLRSCAEVVRPQFSQMDMVQCCLSGDRIRGAAADCAAIATAPLKHQCDDYRGSLYFRA